MTVTAPSFSFVPLSTTVIAAVASSGGVGDCFRASSTYTSVSSPSTCAMSLVVCSKSLLNGFTTAYTLAPFSAIAVNDATPWLVPRLASALEPPVSYNSTVASTASPASSATVTTTSPFSCRQLLPVQGTSVGVTPFGVNIITRFFSLRETASCDGLNPSA